MCPLRYILLALSLIVAFIGLSQAALEADEASSSAGDDDTTTDGSKAAKKSKFQTLVDMLSGRYLLNAYYGAPTAVKVD
ncbi:hypothetical protein H257_12230 [Aphanomyces astaci]|uniref:RxLR effector protein n=1 Tax=Aphanomyces astaci TaxID=112090 RepID=W4FZI0_APHAT|nr:hypothetical protein H257_12230 [Aphanomyces astaci]ETV72892.1 hypothetical protein H257_12230 [Aphanomyces astaci]KAF0704666.1 hypothetical protein AaE_014819 [Aphanomyces astaci]RHY42183.1 hypothetical protein DYB38_014313 [Aphanomyces astaci]RHY85507.1 hypothetical protein DYB35_013665 [Aphanomyces astaci]RHZ20503.1 hypothetical protein DYB37_006671 [Aphanomyces astaci]|eukprot:XP_009837678.1 hypothetical protein H257_12230 [Aphanomyces astaci]